ncbi:MAG: cadherin-like beta sandwich domain-containing protein [Synergistaceae bacterium]|jgi:hypothetical protein|nr:cadherin-like beta sandwich domain-containing protein [Synergistaceae bacterium]
MKKIRMAAWGIALSLVFVFPTLAAAAPKLTSLAVDDGTLSGNTITPKFDPNTHYYSIKVGEEIQGVKVAATAVDGFEINIASSYEIDARVNGDAPKREKNGEWWPYAKDWPRISFPKGTATVQIIKPPLYANSAGLEAAGRYSEGLNGKKVVFAYVSVTDGSDVATYTIKVTVADGVPSYRHFKNFTGKNGGSGRNTAGETIAYDGPAYKASNGTYINYLLYVPSNLGTNEKLPVILAPHGGGQTRQPPDMSIRRYQLGTAFSKRSEAQGPGGDRRCIVLTPHITTYDFSAWPPVKGFNPDRNGGNDENAVSYAMAIDPTDGKKGYTLTHFGVASFELLDKLVKGEAPFTDLAGKTDSSRVYLEGFSNGGGCGVAMLAARPDYFAAAYIAAPAGIWNPDDAQKVVKGSTAIWASHAYDDATVDFHNTEINVGLLKQNGIAANKLREEYIPSGTYTYSSAHFFGQIAPYYNEEFMSWLFAQRRGQ